MSKRCLGCMELFGDEFQVCPHCGYVVGTKAAEAIHMDPGTLLYNRYIIGKVLGYGGFGVTYLGWDGRLEQKVAIKEYLPGEFSTRMPGQSQITVFNGEKSDQFHDGLKKFVEEAKHLAKFQNEPGIVKIFDSFEENDTAYIIMEYLEGETLADYLKREKTIPEDKAVEMMQPILGSLQVVHEEGLLHRDIAPDNIFLTTSGEVKLIDFGASRYATTSHSKSLTVIIKPGYSPEEQYRSRGDQGPHTDVYAVSATLYKMITGKTPPDAMERRAKYESKNKDILENPRKLCKNLSRSREVAIMNALNVRIEDRTPDIATFVSELNADPPAKRRYGKIKKIDLYRMPVWLKILTPVLLSVVIVFMALLMLDVISFSRFSERIVIPDGIVVVPDVEGMYADEAIEAIEAEHLLAATAESIESEYIPAGKIILQDPVSGSYMNVNGTVALTVSSGTAVQEAVDGISTVPYVIWDEQETAISKLEQAGLSDIQIEEVYDNNVTAGQVISQSIEAGTEVEEGSSITIVVSLGPESFELPNVEGLTLTEAQSTLESLGLVVTVEYQQNDDVETDCVISQDTATGTEVKRGDKVTLTVSSGKSTVSVPVVSGESYKDAVEILEAQGFKVNKLENYDSNIESGVVISQSPEAGTSQVKGATITVIVSKGKQPITATLDGNGGKASQETLTVYNGNKYGTLPTAERTGFTFAGWYTAADGGEKVTESTEVTAQSSFTLYAHWTVSSYTASWSNGTGYTVTVTRTSSPYGGASTGTLSSGDKVYYGDVLSVTYSANPGFTVSSSGVTSITVSGNVASNDIYATTTVSSYTANWSAGSNCSITVTRTSSPNGGASTGTLNSGATVYYGDVLSVTYSANSGFTISSCGQSTITVTGNISSKDIYATASAGGYTVSWSNGANYTVTVTRTSSPYGNASNGTLSSGATVYYGDVLSVTYTASTGYVISSSGSSSITVSGNVTSSEIYATVSASSYTASWSDGTNYTVSVSRTSSPYGNGSTGTLSNGATVYYGDVLSVTYTASTGYKIATSGSTSITVTGNVTSSQIYATVSVATYTASWSTGTGYTISVSRTSSPYGGASTGTLSSGATVYYGDVLSVTYTANTGYTISSKGSTSITVSGNVTSSNIYATASVNSYTASWSTGTGYTISVSRTSSPYGGASTGTLSSGATVYYGDVLSVTYTANTGYTISTSGSTSITVSGNVTSSNIYATATVNSYTASWSTGTGYTIAVSRTSSPYGGASTGTLSSGATVYYGDVLSVTYTASTGYTISTKGSTSITVTGNVTSNIIYATASVSSYTATWSTVTGCTIAVKRTSSPYQGASTGTLSSGATVYYGDVLSVTYTASTGYTISSKGSTSITVTGNVTSSNIYATVSANSYTASWSTSTGCTITVKRTSSPYGGASTGTLSSGATVYYGDVLSVTYTANTGYTISTKGSTSITVTGNVTSSTIYATATVSSYTASWNTGTGYTITVKRTSSPYGGASTGTLSSGAKVYYGDVLSVTYTASTGYTISSKGSTSITVSGNVTSSNIYATASVSSYTVSWNTGTGYTITVKRTSSPYKGASTGTLSSGATVYYGDVLSVTYSASTGYTISSKGSTSITVSGNVTSSTIYATATVQSYTYNIVYKSSNGTSLGTATATYNYGTTNTITPKSFSGYTTPSSQSIKWDSTTAKTITFTYSPSSVTNSTYTGTRMTSPSMSYAATFEYQNRTATSVQIRVTWKLTINSGWNNYGQAIKLTAGGNSTTSTIVAWGTWSSSSSSARSASGTTGWVTVSLSTTNQTTVSASIYSYQLNGAGEDATKYGASSATYSFNVNIPAY